MNSENSENPENLQKALETRCTDIKVFVSSLDDAYRISFFKTKNDKVVFDVMLFFKYKDIKGSPDEYIYNYTTKKYGMFLW